jgi:hypothetical protein
MKRAFVVEARAEDGEPSVWLEDFLGWSFTEIPLPEEIARKARLEAMADLDEIKREARLEVEALLRRCVIELVYINDGVENCDSGLCATGEGKECISEAVRLLGPVATWPEIRTAEDVRWE